MTNIVIRRKQMPPSWYEIPGREVLIRPLPIDSIIAVVANLIEEASKYHRKDFRPDFPMSAMVFSRVMLDISLWFKNNLVFGDWRYEFNTLTDTSYGNASVEIVVVRKYFPLKICLIDQWIDAVGYYHSFEDGWCGYTAIDFVDTIRGMLEQVNQTVRRWNEICRRAKPFFVSPLPVYEIVNEALNQVEDVYLSEIFELGLRGGIELYALLAIRTLQAIVPYKFGVWEFDVNVIEHNDWFLMQCYLRNEYFPELAFILLETEVNRFEVLPREGFERYVENLLFTCERSMIAWNKLLSEEGSAVVKHYYL